MTITKQRGFLALKEHYMDTDPALFNRLIQFLVQTSPEYMQAWDLTPEDSNKTIAEYIKRRADPEPADNCLWQPMSWVAACGYALLAVGKYVARSLQWHSDPEVDDAAKEPLLNL